MSGYPPASSYGPPPGLTTLNSSYQPQHGDNSQQQRYQQYDNTQYDYSNHQGNANTAAFSNNATYQGTYQNPVPPFSAAAVASGVPPLPIYPQWQMDNNPQTYGTSFWGPPQQQQPPQQYQQQQHQQPPQQYQQHQQHQPQPQQHIHYDQQGYAPYDPLNAGLHLNNASGPSPMSFTPQPILHAQIQPPSQPQPQMFAPPTGPRGRPAVEEGELSEGEYVPSPKRLPQRSREREQRFNKKNFQDAPKEPAAAEDRKQREDNSFPDRNDRQISQDYDHYSPPQQFRRSSFSRQSSQSSQDRQMELRGGVPVKHKRKVPKVRKEAAREAARRETPSTSRRQSVSGPAPKQAPLPPLPAVVPQALQDARKQAQNAVLNLLPLKVRFDNYIQEGIDEKVVEKVFADVGLSPTRDSAKIENKAASKPAPQQPVLPGLSAGPPPKVPLPENPAASAPKEKADNPPSLGNRKPSVAPAAPGNKAEERKDRIARLLADKNKKAARPVDPPTETAVPTVTPVPVVATTTIPNPAPMQHPLPSKPKSRESPMPEAPAPDVVVAVAPKVDKDALLRQKMEALQQKSAADKDALLRKKLEEMEVSRIHKPTDKDAILRQKMENLRKSREKREPESLTNQASTPLSQEQFSEQSTNGAAPGHSLQATMPAFNSFAQFQSALSPMPAYPPQNGMPAIPGLFLGVQPVESSAQPFAAPPAAPINTRKRPVASDFDSSASTPPTYKKPFGHVQQDSVFIDVSDESEDDDEDEDAMELDEPTDTFSRDTNIWAKPHMRDLPPLSDFPPKRAYTAPNSAVGTPPVSQSFPRPAARPEDLKRKEFEIQEMRRRIAEAEERKKAKLAAVGSSNSTPKTPPSNELSASVDRIETSNQIERLMSDASRKIEEDQQKLAETQMLQEQKTRDLKKAEDEQRRKRRAELQANLPAVDADVQETQRKLAEMRAEMQRLEVDMQRKLDGKRRLAEEMEKLNVEADEQLEAQKEQLKEINKDIATVEQDHRFRSILNQDPSAHSLVAAVTVSESADAGPEATDVDIPADAVNQASSTSSCESPSYTAQEPENAESPGFVEKATTPASQIQNVATDKVNGHLIVKEKSDNDEPEAVTDHDSPKKSIEVDHKEIEMSSGSESTPMVESSDSSRSSESQDRGVPVPQRTSSSDPSDQSMDESSSADMEIDETPSQIACLPVRTEESTSSESSEESSDSSDDDSDSDNTTQQDNGVRVNEDAEMPDVSDTSSDESTSESEAEEYEQAAPSSPTAEPAAVPKSPSNSVASNTFPSDVPSAQDAVVHQAAAPALAASKPVQESVVAASNTEATSTNEAASKPSSRFFTPYDSPLKHFHVYRFHPRFTREVPGGYKSITYSNDIKDKEEFCRFELAGGVCNDPQCDMQHFRDIQLPDGAILEVLGNPKGLAEDEKMRFITGLKQVLSEMRAQNVRSFDKIAANIVHFRHKFFGDDSKVLLLDGSPYR